MRLATYLIYHITVYLNIKVIIYSLYVLYIQYYKYYTLRYLIYIINKYVFIKLINTIVSRSRQKYLLYYLDR